MELQPQGSEGPRGNRAEWEGEQRGWLVDPGSPPRTLIFFVRARSQWSFQGSAVIWSMLKIQLPPVAVKEIDVWGKGRRETHSQGPWVLPSAITCPAGSG